MSSYSFHQVVDHCEGGQTDLLNNQFQEYIITALIVVENTTLQIALIHVMMPKPRRQRRSLQPVGVVVDVVADTKFTARSGETTRNMRIEMIM